MSPMGKSLLGIENPLVGPLFKPILIFEKKFDEKSKFWILDFYAIFTKGFGQEIY